MARVMPSNKEAEMSVLGISFIDNNLIDDITDILTPDMFFDERNRYLFEAIKELHDNGTSVDAGTIKDELDKKKRFNLVGGLEYISEVIDSVITTANLSYYIEIIKNAAIRRNLINTATDIINDSYDEDDVTTLLDKAEKNIIGAMN